MLFFTLLKAARQITWCAAGINGEFAKDGIPHHVVLYTPEIIVARRFVGSSDEPQYYIFYIREIRRENDALISGYMIEGEDQL